MSKSRPLYDVLGVAQTATEAEIARAYRKRALQFHPDRNPDGVEQFKELSNAYAILNNAEKRGLYDLTGIVPGSAQDASNSAKNGETKEEHSEIVKEQLAVFFRTYAGSEEEKQDFTESYKKAGGNFRKMVREYLVFDNGVESQVRRLHALGEALVQAGRLAANDTWRQSTTPQGVRKAERDMQKEREEAEVVLKEMGLDEQSVSRAKAARENADLGALQALIQQRQQNSWQSMMSNLESKYVDTDKETRRTAKFNKKAKSSRRQRSRERDVDGGEEEGGWSKAEDGVPPPPSQRRRRQRESTTL